MASYIYISPLMAIFAMVLAALLGAPVWMVVLAFLVTGSGVAFATALLVFFASQRSKAENSECREDLSCRHSTLIGQ